MVLPAHVAILAVTCLPSQDPGRHLFPPRHQVSSLFSLLCDTCSSALSFACEVMRIERQVQLSVNGLAATTSRLCSGTR